MYGKRRVLGVENVGDEEEYNQYDELPPEGPHNIKEEKRKIIRNPKFIRGQPNDSDHPKYMGIK